MLARRNTPSHFTCQSCNIAPITCGGDRPSAIRRYCTLSESVGRRVGCRRKEVEAGLTSGAGEVETEEGVAEGDGETLHNPIVDDLADEGETPETRGVVADPPIGALGAQGHAPPRFPGSAPFSVKLMWELGWLYVGERRLWTLHLVSWPTDANTSPTRYQPLTV